MEDRAEEYSRRADQLLRLAQSAPLSVRRRLSELARALLTLAAKRHEMMAKTRLTWPPGKSSWADEESDA
jgi:hypothetical protein